METIVDDEPLITQTDVSESEEMSNYITLLTTKCLNDDIEKDYEIAQSKVDDISPTSYVTKRELEMGFSNLEDLNKNVFSDNECRSDNFSLQSTSSILLFSAKNEEGRVEVSATDVLQSQNNIEIGKRKGSESKESHYDDLKKIMNLDNVSCERDSQVVGILTFKTLKADIPLQDIKTEEFMSLSNNQLTHVQDEGENIQIGLSAAEELEVMEIIERAEVEYSRTEATDCVKGKENKNIKKKVNDLYLRITHIEENQSSSKCAPKSIHNRGDYMSSESEINAEDTKNLNEVIKKHSKEEEACNKREVLTLKEESSKYVRVYSDNRKYRPNYKHNNKNEMSPWCGNNRIESISVEDRELIRELVSIAVEKRHGDCSYHNFGLDRRGLIIKEFAKEYFRQLNIKSQSASVSNAYHTSKIKFRTSTVTNVCKEKGDYFNSRNDSLYTRTPNDCSDAVPRYSLYSDKPRHTHEARSEKKRYTDHLNPKGKYDVKEGISKYLQAKSGPSFERKRASSYKHLLMNEKNGLFYLDRDLVPVDLYQEGLIVHQWNPTSVLNEISAKCGWTLPTFKIEHNEYGFLATVKVNEEEFIPQIRGLTKKDAKHIASSHFLQRIGFQCKWDQFLCSTGYDDDYPDDDDSISSRSRKTQESEEEDLQISSKSRRCRCHSRRRSISYEDDAREGRRRDKHRPHYFHDTWWG